MEHLRRIEGSGEPKPPRNGELTLRTEQSLHGFDWSSLVRTGPLEGWPPPKKSSLRKPAKSLIDVATDKSGEVVTKAYGLDITMPREITYMPRVKTVFLPDKAEKKSSVDFVCPGYVDKEWALGTWTRLTRQGKSTKHLAIQLKAGMESRPRAEYRPVVCPSDGYRKSSVELVASRKSPRLASVEGGLDLGRIVVATLCSPVAGAVTALETCLKYKEGCAAKVGRGAVKAFGYTLGIGVIGDVVKLLTDSVTKEDPESDAKKFRDCAQAHFLNRVCLNTAL